MAAQMAAAMGVPVEAAPALAAAPAVDEDWQWLVEQQQSRQQWGQQQ